MIRVFTMHVSNFSQGRPEEFPVQVEEACSRLESDADVPPKSSLDLSYDEIAQEEVDLVFGYEKICEVNGAYGLPNLPSPVRPPNNSPGSGLLFFPLHSFESYLRENFSTISTEYEAARNMDRYAEAKIENMTATEYLVGGLFELIRHCQQYGRILAIHW